MEKVIFIIDDTRVYNTFMKVQLSQLGDYRVEAYETGESALKQLSNRTPFMIILDHNLEGNDSRDGLHYLSEIKKIKPLVPVLYITGDRSPALEKKALHAGANKLIVKSPNILEQLKEGIDEINNPRKVSFLSRLFQKK
jgi:Response regulator containing CheY-like receiver, AAA-type ATPase, and DNA-binding domains